MMVSAEAAQKVALYLNTGEKAVFDLGRACVPPAVTPWLLDPRDWTPAVKT